MRILWLLPVLPFPPDTGGKQDPYYMISILSSLGDQITAAPVYRQDKPPDVPAEFAALVSDTVFLPGNPKSTYLRLFESLSDTLPFKLRQYYSEKAIGIVHDLLTRTPPYDVVIADHLHLVPVALESRKLVLDSGGTPPLFVLRTPNVESIIVEKYAHRIDNPLVKTFAGREAVKMKAYETKVLGEFDLVAAISPVDADILRTMSMEPDRIVCVTAGVDVDNLRPSDEEPKRGEVVFVGSFDWHPNVDGALWMIEKVWPSVLHRIPDAHLSLVGRNPPPYLRKAEQKSIAVTGRVESVGDYIRNASAVAVPLWIGSGMRLKILEAFAHGKPVVSTSLGAEGIEANDGEHILIRDDPAEFADALVKVLKDRLLQRTLGANARALVERKYSWSKVTGDLRAAIEQRLAR